MELLYLWIDEHYVLKNCGFQFSNRYLFQESRSKDSDKIKLKVRPNADFIEQFFPGNVNSITAIVGENGVGKSSLLDLLVRINHHPDSIYGKWVAIYFNHKNQKLLLRGPLSETSQVLNFDFGELVIEYEHELEEPFVGDNSDDGIKPQAVSIFYNPSLDLKDYKRSFDSLGLGIVDVSTNHLILLDNENNYERTFDQVEQHRFKNTYRQFALSQSHLIKIGTFQIPKNIEVRFNKTSRIETSDLGSFAHDVYDHLDKTGREDFDRTYRISKEANASENWEDIQRAKLEKVKLWFVRNLIDNFFANLANEKDLHDGIFIGKVEELNKQTFFENVQTFFEKQEYIPRSKFSIWDFVERIFAIIDQHAVLENEVAENDSFFEVPVREALQVHQLHLNYKSQFGHSTLHAFLHDTDNGFLDFNWRDLSNGEKAYFDLFSRLFHGYRRLESRIVNFPTLFILIDEGEIGFHPQWQKEYISRLIDFINAMTPGLSVQIILTSHSPFVLSDLPKSNIVLLSKSTGSKTVVAELSVREQTFAANIHELFTDSFFIHNGTIGDFAARKIQEIIALINRQEVNNDQTLYAKKLIALVGEPIVKDRLTDLFNERFGKVETLEERIVRLRQELNEAERQISRNDKD